MTKESAAKRAFSTVLLVLALAAAAMLPASCGKGTGEDGSAGGERSSVKVEIEDTSDIDALIKDLDSSIGSLSDEDFAPDQLNDNQLGW